MRSFFPSAAPAAHWRPASSAGIGLCAAAGAPLRPDGTLPLRGRQPSAFGRLLSNMSFKPNNNRYAIIVGLILVLDLRTLARRMAKPRDKIGSFLLLALALLSLVAARWWRTSLRLGVPMLSPAGLKELTDYLIILGFALGLWAVAHLIRNRSK